MTEPNWNCLHCKGSAYERTWLLITYRRHPSGDEKSCEENEITEEAAKKLMQEVDGHFQKVVDAVKYCRCHYGRHIRQMRLARLAEEEDKAHRGSRRAQ